jgi:hypothetical protein
MGDRKKTNVMKFKTGGKLARYDYLTCGKDRLEAVSWFIYLGITLHTSKTSCTRHIQDRVAAAIQAIHDISHLSLLSTDTAIALFSLKKSLL